MCILQIVDQILCLKIRKHVIILNLAPETKKLKILGLAKLELQSFKHAQNPKKLGMLM